LKKRNLLKARSRGSDLIKEIWQHWFQVEWVGRDGLSPDTHEKYLNEFVNHFYKNVLKLIDRGVRKSTGKL
jgi:hypothetical protein